MVDAADLLLRPVAADNAAMQSEPTSSYDRTVRCVSVYLCLIAALLAFSMYAAPEGTPLFIIPVGLCAFVGLLVGASVGRPFVGLFGGTLFGVAAIGVVLWILSHAAFD
jgi:hypothetical protein